MSLRAVTATALAALVLTGCGAGEEVAASDARVCEEQAQELEHLRFVASFPSVLSADALDASAPAVPRLVEWMNDTSDPELTQRIAGAIDATAALNREAQANFGGRVLGTPRVSQALDSLSSWCEG